MAAELAWCFGVSIVVVEVAADCACDFVVVDDEVAGLGVGFDVGAFACSWWADDEDDVGACGFPGVFACAVDAGVVAGGAGGSEVGGVVPGSALVDGDDVVDVESNAGAFGSGDLAGVVVSFEDGAADALPWSSVDGVGWFAHFSYPQARIR